MGVAVVFPGQGSQRPGMAADFAERFPEARAVFEEASAALELDVARICAGDDRLNLTEFTQPCILTAEIAMLVALRAHFGLSAERFGGHSLGEYTALVAAGALPLADAVRLVRLRGRLMQDAVPVGRGGMVAVIQRALDLEAVAGIARISGSVRWIDNMRALAAGADRIIEVGPGRPLSRFFKDLGHEVAAILNVRGAEKVLS